MLRSISELVYRERRRLVFVTSLAFIAGLLLYARLDLHIGGIHISVLTGLFYAAVVGPVALIVCGLFPGLRFMIDGVAVSRLCVALLAFFWPEMGTSIVTNPMLTAMFVVSLGTLLSRAMHGRIVREKAKNWREAFRNRHALRRKPVRMEGTELQYRFVGWVDGREPVAV